MKKLLSAPLSSRKLVEYLLLFLLLALVLSAAAYGGYWYGKGVAEPAASSATPQNGTRQQPSSRFPQSNTAATADWKTYQNPQTYLSFLYPLDDNLQTQDKNGKLIINVTNKNYSLEIESEIRPDADLDLVAKRIYPDFSSCRQINPDFDLTPIADDKLTFPGIVAKSYSYRFCSKTDSRYHFVYVIAWKDRVFVVRQSFEYDSSDNVFSLGKYNKISSQILSTFRFLDQRATEGELGVTMGYVKKTYEKDGNKYIEVDYVKWLTQQEREKAMEAAGGRLTTFLKYTGQEGTLPLLPTVEIQVLATGGEDSELKKVSYLEFADLVSKANSAGAGPFSLKFQGDAVEEIVQQYTP